MSSGELTMVVNSFDTSEEELLLDIERFKRMGYKESLFDSITDLKIDFVNGQYLL
jgi:hypothetical protein